MSSGAIVTAIIVFAIFFGGFFYFALMDGSHKKDPTITP